VALGQYVQRSMFQTVVTLDACNGGINGKGSSWSVHKPNSTIGLNR